MEGTMEARIAGVSQRASKVLAAAVAISVVFAAGPALARPPKACTATANALFGSCKAEAVDDAFVAKAVCINISDEAQRGQCSDEIKSARAEKKQLCAEQREVRLDACTLLGEGRYDPDFNPALFDDPKNPTNPNPYFPLTVGNRWEYRGGDELNVVEALNEIKLITGIPCLVFDDQVFKGGELHEATDDWFCQRKNGDVWYLGEETKEFESFSGDVPKNPELVSIDGSFKSGRDGDKGGLFFPLSPAVGTAYLEEFSVGNAEDVTEILSTTYAFGASAELDQGVPQALAARFCSAGDCVVTRNFSLLEPGQFARKYYAMGIGVILEVEVEDTQLQGTSQLTDCNFDARCQNLPTP
jgi:hypothetical protein